MAKDESGHVELRQCGFTLTEGRLKVRCTNRLGHTNDHNAGFVSWERLFGDEQPPSQDWTCRCTAECWFRGTQAERDEHERTVHPGEPIRKDLDDTPPSARRQRHA